MEVLVYFTLLVPSKFKPIHLFQTEIKRKSERIVFISFLVDGFIFNLILFYGLEFGLDWGYAVGNGGEFHIRRIWSDRKVAYDALTNNVFLHQNTFLKARKF